MAGLAAVTMTGVLQSTLGTAPIPEGFNLYQALVSTYRVCVVLDDMSSEMAALWLRKEGFRNYAQLHVQRPLDDRLVQYRRLQALGPIELIVDPDPAVISQAMELGIPSLLFAHPGVARPEWRPDHDRTPRPWDQLVERVETVRLVENEE